MRGLVVKLFRQKFSDKISESVCSNFYQFQVYVLISTRITMYELTKSTVVELNSKSILNE